MGRRRLPVPTGDRICKKCNIPQPIETSFPRINLHTDRINFSGVCKTCWGKRSVERQNQLRKDGFCRCGRKPVEGLTICSVCQAGDKLGRKRNKENIQKKSKNYKNGLRKQIFAAYGNACKCCGEGTFEFLEIDHEGGWGNKHVDEKGKRMFGIKLYLWIIRNSFPSGFRILCGSCHSAISYHGYCPHQKSALESPLTQISVSQGHLSL